MQDFFVLTKDLGLKKWNDRSYYNTLGIRYCTTYIITHNTDMTFKKCVLYDRDAKYYNNLKYYSGSTGIGLAKCQIVSSLYYNFYSPHTLHITM